MNFAPSEDLDQPRHFVGFFMLWLKWFFAILELADFHKGDITNCQTNAKQTHSVYI